jgi:hypothetical protein
MGSSNADVSIGSVLLDGSGAYFSSFGRFAGIAILAHSPVMLIDAISVLAPSSDGTGAGGLTQISAFLGTVALAVTSAYVVPPVMSTLGKRDAPTLGQVGQRIGSALGTAWITNLIVGLGILCFIVPGLVLGTYYCVAIPAAVAESVGAGAAMKRSTALTEGHRLTAFLLNMLYGFVLLVVVLGGAMPAIFLEMEAVNGGHVETPVLLLANLVPTVFQAIIVAWGSALFTALYVRLREVKDGIDAAALADVFS